VDCRVRISSVEHPAIVSTSPADFTISDVPTLLLRSPNGEETWLEGEQKTIIWGSQWYDGLVKIEINRDYPGGAWETLFASADNDGIELWIVRGNPSPRCRMRISSLGQFPVSAFSARDFTIGYRPSLFYEPYNTPLQLEATVSGDNPAPMVLLLSRQGEGSLNWTAAPANPSFPLWVSPSNGTIGPGKNLLEVGASIQGLEAGTYAWAITITAPGAVNSPLVIPITVKVNPASVVVPCALSPGWNMISLPVTPTSSDPNVVFNGLPPGWVMYAWDAVNGRYIGKEQIVLGLTEGYWLKVSTAVEYSVSGQPNGAAQTEIDLGLGWNLIGVPYEGAIPWGMLRVSKDGGTLVTLDQAITSDWIQGTFYRWSGSAYQGLTTGGIFQPLSGYWAKTKVGSVRLVFMKP
jgi:hypothetical protein